MAVNTKLDLMEGLTRRQIERSDSKYITNSISRVSVTIFKLRVLRLNPSTSCTYNQRTSTGTGPRLVYEGADTFCIIR